VFDGFEDIFIADHGGNKTVLANHLSHALDIRDVKVATAQ
jgi:hypothetical protein